MLVDNVDFSLGFGVYIKSTFLFLLKAPFSCSSLLFFTVGLGCRHDMNRTNFWSCSHMVLNINFVTYVVSNHSFFNILQGNDVLRKSTKQLEVGNC